MMTRTGTPSFLVLVLAASASLASGCGGDDPSSATDAQGVTDAGTTNDAAANDIHANDIHANDIHANDIHANDIHANDIHAADGAASGQDAAVDTATTPKDTGSSIACHPVNNTGCPAGEHCVWQGNSIACTTDGEHAAGADCSDGKGCKIGVCVSIQGSNKSVCSPHCLANLECDSGICNKLQNSKGKICDMGVQVTQCNPLGTDCDPGDGCYPGGNGFVCMAKGAVESGKVCPNDNSCAPGLACVGKSGTGGGVCRKICKIGGGLPACDDISSSCSSLLGSGKVGYCGG